MTTVSPPPGVGGGAGTVAAPTTSTPAAPTGAGGIGAPSSQNTAVGAGPETPAIDVADIRPLDVQGALQILVAEVQLSLVEALGGVPAADPVTPAESAASNPLVYGNGATVSNSTHPEGSVGTVENVTASRGSAANIVNVANARILESAGAVAGNTAAENLDGPVPAARVLVGLVLHALPETFEPAAWSSVLPRTDAALQAGVQSAVKAISAWKDMTPSVLATVREAGTLALSLIADEPVYPVWPPAEWFGMASRLGLYWRRRRALKRHLLDPDYEMQSDHQSGAAHADPNEPNA